MFLLFTDKWRKKGTNSRIKDDKTGQETEKNNKDQKTEIISGKQMIKKVIQTQFINTRKEKSIPKENQCNPKRKLLSSFLICKERASASSFLSAPMKTVNFSIPLRNVPDFLVAASRKDAFSCIKPVNLLNHALGLTVSMIIRSTKENRMTL